MKSSIYGDPVPPKKDRRDQAREKARLQLAAAQKRERRVRWAWRGGIGLGLIAIVAVIAIVIVGGARPAGAGPLNMASDGIVLTGDGTTVTAVTTPALAADATPVATDPTASPDTVNIVTYIDYLCPFCGQFEATNAAQITSWLTAGNATLEVHPISILDASSKGTKYSTRAANAAACVANYDPNNFLAVNTALFTQQPKENTEGLTNAQLTTLVKDAGATDPKIATCITDGTFSAWVATATDRALSGPLPNANIPKVNGTPTVIVNGVAYTGALDDATAFQTFVTQQAAAASAGSTATPTPTPAPTPTP
ncbi:thioredoxin domain-containing protein [Leifsonia kafniensis]|uniref:Thioredoxin domain-containing protein n=1 Tax=Leifsonia kafniensis TaxID=475957 RepID=A0ABP7KZZ3_9MICO